uniref:Uncharacterized protein n=1 Tax=Ananas comosus var. bracteatus TaxID=296719 RepID=A0A6V7NLB2_ANACO|nr:unnamed protein product [Ananas comosus var. bracteatus]
MSSPVAAMVLPSATAAAAAPASSSSLRHLSPLTLLLLLFPLPLRLPRRSKNPGIACQATIDTEPEGNNEDEEKGATGEIGEGTSSHAANGIAQDNGHLDYNSVSDKEKNESDSVELSTIHETSQLNERDPVTPQGIQEKDDDLDVASGSPLPGMKQQLRETIRIPKGTIDILKDQVFGFDTFFVTSQEPYEGGVLFKGNLRGKAAKSYEKITKRLQERFGDQYKLFFS